MIVSAITGETGALKQAEYRQAWAKGATTLEEYDYYLRGHEHYVKYTKEWGDRAVGRDLERRISEVSEFAAPQSETRLAPYDARDDLLR